MNRACTSRDLTIHYVSDGNEVHSRTTWAVNTRYLPRCFRFIPESCGALEDQTVSFIMVQHTTQSDSRHKLPRWVVFLTYLYSSPTSIKVRREMA